MPGQCHTPSAYPLDPHERWERFMLDGVHAGFLHRRVEADVLTVRTGFQPTQAHREANPSLPEKFLSQCRVGFASDGSTWRWLDYEDSQTRQRVHIDRERAGIDPSVVPSYAEPLLAAGVVREGAPLRVRRLEESSPLHGSTRIDEAVLRPVADSVPEGLDLQGAAVTRVETVSQGQVLCAHVLADARMLASDWGAGAVTVPAESEDQALAGLDEDLETFARLPH